MRKFVTYSMLIALIIVSTMIILVNFSELKMTYLKEISDYYLSISIAALGYSLIIKRRLSFIENLFHEITHVLFSILLLEKVTHFFVSSTRGEIQTNSTSPNIFSALSPYFFPVFTFLLIATWEVFNIQQLKETIIVSYGFFIAIMIKQIIIDKLEALSFSWYGILLIIKMNFWVSLFVFNWASGNMELDYKSLISYLYEFNRF